MAHRAMCRDYVVVRPRTGNVRSNPTQKSASNARVTFRLDHVGRSEAVVGAARLSVLMQQPASPNFPVSHSPNIRINPRLRTFPTDTFAAGPPALMTAADSKAHAANSEGIEHYNQEHWDVALGHFQKAVGADPNSAEAHYNLALALDKTDKHKEAAMEFKKAQDLGKDNPDIQNSKILLGHVKMLEGGK